MAKQKREIRQWATIHRGLGNQNRLRILQLLGKHGELSVSDLAGKLHITIKNTSRNLLILSNLDMVQFQGKAGKVYYAIRKDMPEDIRHMVRLSLP